MPKNPFTFGFRQTITRRLANQEHANRRQGVDTVERVRVVYDRALSYCYSVWPQHDFTWLVNLRERRLKRAADIARRYPAR